MKLLCFPLLFALATTLTATSRIDRIEPMNWWVGMRNPNLQLLIYGDQVSELEPRLDYPGVAIRHSIHVPNSNYLFIDLKLSAQAQPGVCEIEFLRAGEVVLRHEYPLLARRPRSAEREGFNPSDVMYLITPDRFANGDRGNDSIEGMAEAVDRAFKGGRHGGDIQGIVDHLDYLKTMGFTAIWVNPVLENDMPTYSYHGYAATDFYKVDRRYGSNEAYREFIQLAKEKGIKVIMDMILNHCGSEHWFVKDPPMDDWINFGGQYVNTSHRRTTNQDIHASEVDKELFSDGWFARTMPDLNQRNELMATYLIQNSIWWIEYADLAGIRMDTYPYPDKDFMRDWTCALMAEYPHFNIVGEEWSLKPAVVSYWQRGKINHDGYTSCLRSLMDFPLRDAVTAALTEPEGAFAEGWPRLYEAIAMDFLYPDPSQLVIFPDNHDMDRFFTQVDEDLDLFKLGIACYLTMRGVPQIYYGTEVLMTNRDAHGDHGIIRTDFPGGWPGDAVNAFSGEGLTSEQASAKAYMCTLLNWRKSATAVHQGKLMHFVPENGVYVYFRYTRKETVMVVLNKNAAESPLPLGRFAECLDGFAVGTDALTGRRFELGDEIAVPARAALVLDLE